ncbi:MAG: hypothetical protein ACRDI0_02295 [Actinomycetota bacterium]
MQAEFFRPAAPDEVVGSAAWDGVAARVDADDPAVRGALERIFRPSAVANADPVPRGTSGPTVLQPGDLQWFLAAARSRAEAEGLGVRFRTLRPGGWDPAGAYRPMGVWVSRHEGAGQKTETLGTP